VHQLKLYKTSLYSKGKDAMTQDFKLVILICFNSLNTEPSYTKHPYLFDSFTEWKISWDVRSARRRGTNSIGASEAEEQCVRIQPPLSSQVSTHPKYPTYRMSIPGKN
jgi:hypothetical protein